MQNLFLVSSKMDLRLSDGALYTEHNGSVFAAMSDILVE